MKKNIQYVRTNQALLKHFAEKDLLRTYAYFIKFKYLFSSSRIHKGNKLKISRLTGISDKTVRIQIGKMRSLGWIREIGNDYIFVSKGEIFKLYKLNPRLSSFKCKIVLDSNDPIKVIITKLASKLIEANLQTQEYTIKLRQQAYSFNSRVDPKPKDRYFFSKRQRKNLQRSELAQKPKPTSEMELLSLSCIGFGKQINKSTSTGCRLKQSMEELGILKVTKRIEVYINMRGDLPKQQRFLKALRSRPYLFKNIWFFKGIAYRRKMDSLIYNKYYMLEVF